MKISFIVQVVSGLIGIIAGYWGNVIFSNICLACVLLINIIANILILTKKYELTKQAVKSKVVMLTATLLFYVSAIIGNCMMNIHTFSGWFIFAIEGVAIIVSLITVSRTIICGRLFGKIVFSSKLTVLFIIIGLFVILSIDSINALLIQDATYYATGVNSFTKIFDFSLNQLSHANICGHITLGYTVLSSIGHFLIPEAYIGIKLIQLILAIAVIVTVWKLINRLKPEASLLSTTLLIAMVAFSQWLFGMISDTTVDYVMMCSAVFFIYFLYREYNELSILCAMLLVTTKEPGVVVLFGIWVANYIYSYIKRKDVNNYLLRAVKCFSIKKWCVCLIPPTFFLLIYFLQNNTGWIGQEAMTMMAADGTKYNFYCFAVVPSHIWSALKLLFVANFRWAISLLIIIFVIIRVKKAISYSEDTIGVLVSLVGGFVAFMGFALSYVSQEYSRYYATAFMYMLLILVLLWLDIPNGVFNRILMIGGVVLLFTENYITIDLPSLLICNRMSSQPFHYMYRTDTIDDGHIIGDTSKYNKQSFYLSKLYEKELVRIGYEQGDVIVFPKFDDWSDHIDEWCFMGIESDNQAAVYWNRSIHRLQNTSEDSIPIQYGFALNKEALKKYTDTYEHVYVFAPKIKIGGEYRAAISGLDEYYLESDTLLGWHLDVYEIQ